MTKDNNNSSKSVLTILFHKKSLCTKVDTLLDEGKTPAYVAEFCKNQGFDISKGSINNYKNKREEAIRTGVPLEHLLDKRQTTGDIIELRPVIDKVAPAMDTYNTGFADTEKKAVTTLTFLEALVEKGMKAIENTPVVDPALALKAVKMIDDISGGNSGGLTVYGMQEMRLKMKAIETAYMTVIMEYIPEDKHNEVFDRFEEAERDFFDNLDLSAEGQKMSNALKELGLGN